MGIQASADDIRTAPIASFGPFRLNAAERRLERNDEAVAIAGDIDAVGPGVSNRIGDWNGQWKQPHGTAAEYIVLPSAQAVQLPPNVSYAEGACLGIAALAAVQTVRLAKIGLCSKVVDFECAQD